MSSGNARLRGRQCPFPSVLVSSIEIVDGRPRVVDDCTKFIYYTLITVTNKKLRYRRGTARCIVSVEICQLPCNSAETTCMTNPEQIEVMKLKRYNKAMCNKHVHSTMTRSSRFRCPVGVINKLTMVDLWISPVYRRLAVAKFSKSTM